MQGIKKTPEQERKLMFHNLKAKWDKQRQNLLEKKVQNVCKGLSDWEFKEFWNAISNKDIVGPHVCLLMNQTEELLAQQMLENGLLIVTRIYPEQDLNRIQKLHELEQKIKKITRFGVSLEHKTFLIVKAEYEKRFSCLVQEYYNA